MKDLMQYAQARSKESKSKLLKVGALLAEGDTILLTSINHLPYGVTGEYEEERDGKLVTKPEVVHAEMSCIAAAARLGIATKGLSLVVTHAPCICCARLIIQSGIGSVYYGEEFFDKSGENGLKLLEECGVKAVKV